MSMHDDIKTVLVSEEQLKAKVAELGEFGLRILSMGTRLDRVTPVSRMSSTISTSLPDRSPSRSLMILTRPLVMVLLPP